MLESLDPYSAYLDREARQSMRESTRGEFGGLGIQVQTREGFVEIVSPIDDTPAQRAGLKPGDRITHVDRISLAEVNLRDAVSRLRGPIGSRVVLTVARNGSPAFDVSLVRELIRTPAVRWHLEDDVGYMRITSFISEHTHEEVADAVTAIRAKLGRKLRGLVIDLRNNPGGLFDEGVAISDDFLDNGLIVSTLGRTQERYYKARKGDMLPGLPIVILVNKGSASAAEIFAGALRDNGRARLIGTQTFGKGSVQTIISLSQDDAVKLTTAHYHTPSGSSVEGGIAPDILVEADEARPGDEELQRALAELRARRN
ncbi:MAG: S41 family peptidase, partial [Alphaproteobacteria bacterium]